jgi:undecaprenyl phosphate-alpha-L-ara4N flippase subunit ArnE
MTTQGILLVILAALMTVAGNLMMREGIVRAGGLSLAFPTLARESAHLVRQPLFDLGLLLYGLASLVWFRIISTENLNSSYPLLVSLTFLFVTLGATLLFREPLSLQKAVGLGLVLLGIVLVAGAR